MSFFNVLYADFAAPSRHILQREIHEAYLKAKASVQVGLKGRKSVVLMFGIWEDAQRCPAVGVMASGRCYYLTRDGPSRGRVITL